MDYIHLGLSLLSLAGTAWLIWAIAIPHPDQETHAIGFHFTPDEEEED